MGKKITIIRPDVAKSIFDNIWLPYRQLATTCGIGEYAAKRYKYTIGLGLTYEKWLESYNKKNIVKASQYMSVEEIESLNVSHCTKLSLKKKFGHTCSGGYDQSEDSKFIKENYGKLSIGQIAKELDLPIAIVKNRVKKLGIVSKRKSPEEKYGELLRENYHNMNLEQLSELLGVSEGYVNTILRGLGYQTKKTLRRGDTQLNIRPLKYPLVRKTKANHNLNPSRIMIIKSSEGIRRVDIGFRNIKVEVPLTATPELIAAKVEKARRIYGAC